MVNTNLLPSKWLENLSDNSNALTYSSYDREYGIKIEVKGLLSNISDSLPTSNCVVVYLFRHPEDEWASAKLFKEVSNPQKAVALGNLIQAFYANENLDYQKVVKLCKSQGLD